jgi:hypothetical protein
VGTAHLGDRLDQPLAIGNQAGDAGFRVRESEQEVLRGDVLVGQAGGLLLGLLQHPDELLRGPDVRHGVAAEARQLLDRVAEAGASRCGVLSEALQHRHYNALILFEQGEQQVGGRHLGVGVLGGEPLGGRHGLLRLDREPVLLHASILAV